jgi:pilus assembly protein Flp/PilA
MLDYIRALMTTRLGREDQRGASAVEYGLLIAGIAALIVVIVFAFGSTLQNVFSTTCGQVASGAGTPGC